MPLQPGAEFPQSDIAILWAIDATPIQLTLDSAEFGLCKWDAVSPGARVSLGKPIGCLGTEWSRVVETVIVRKYDYSAGSATILLTNAPFHFLSRTAIPGASGSSVWIETGSCVGVIHGNSEENTGRAVVVGVSEVERAAIVSAITRGPSIAGRKK